MRKEQFKTALLVVLFLLSVTLTQQLWMSIPLAEIIPSSKETGSKDLQNSDNIKDISNIVSPQSFIVNFGGGLHTVFYSDSYSIGEANSQGIWPETLRVLKNNYFEEGATVEEIGKEVWVEAKNSRSLLMNFEYSLPMAVVRNMAEGKEAGIAGRIQEFDSILVGTSDDSVIFLANNATEKYYRIKGKEPGNSFSDILTTIETSGYNVYYAIQDIYGDMVSVRNDGESDRLIPVSLKDNIPRIQVVNEIDIYNEAQVSAFSSTFFGESFDFVRKITETSGSVIYMYGYGQRALKIDESGTLEYMEEMDSQKSAGNPDFWESMKAAIRFVGEHGGWPNKYAYLKDVRPIEINKRRGYEFIFGYKLNGLPVYYNDKLSPEPIEIQVIGKQVVHYKRFIKREKIGVNFLEEEDVKDTTILAPLHIIDVNFDKIKADYISHRSESSEKIDEKDIGKEVLSSIQSIKLGYYDQPMREPNKLIPIWIIEFDPYTYYFDAYNGKIVYQSEK